jgi:hypothetical protein
LDSAGNVDFEKVNKFKKRKIEPLQQIDHSKSEYEAFQKVFFPFCFNFV